MNVRKFSAEYSLLFSCIKGYLDPSHPIEKHTGVDESHFLHIVERHRITPLIHKVAEPLDLFSELTKSHLRQSFEQNVFRSMAAKMEMLSLMKTHAGSSSKMLFLKGLILAEKYYGDISQRHTMDVDVWVESDVIDATIPALLKRGYNSSPDWKQLNNSQRSFFRKAYHDLLFTNSSAMHQIPIELHWRLREGNGQFNFDPAIEWHTMGEMPFGNAVIPIMNDIDQFIYLCVHGTEHAWFRLKWLVDLPVMISRVELDWDALYKRAVALNANKHVVVSLLMLNQVLGTPVPEIIQKHANMNAYNPILEHCWKQMLSDAHFNSNDTKRFETLLFNMRISHSHKKNYSYLLKYLTNPNDWKLVRLPDYLFFLYFFLRPFLFVYRRLKK